MVKTRRAPSIVAFMLKVLTGIFWLSSALADNTVLQMFPMQHRMPQELLPTIQSMVGPDGAVTAIQTQLMVRATPDRMRDIEAVIQSLDTAIQNLKITVKHGLTQRAERSSIDVAVNGRVYGRSGVGVRGGNVQNGDALDVSIQDNDLDQQSSTSEFLTVMDGRSAYIKVGQLIPFTSQWSMLVQRYALTRTSTEFREISTGFTVTPRQIGQDVELEITPTISSFNAGNTIQFTRLTTVVRVRKREWLDLGGMVESRDEVSQQILSRGSHSGNKHETLMVKVED